MTEINKENLFAWAEDRCGALPEHLWADTPEYAVLRRPDNRKWFAIFMEVDGAHLGLPGRGTVPVVNVKCDPRMLGSLLQSEGYLPAYHMNKERWVTVLLDGSVPEAEVLRMLELSYGLTEPKRKTRRVKEP